MKYTFSCFLSGEKSAGHICRDDGQVVLISADEVPALLLDLAADPEGSIGRLKHHTQVLGEWFERKSAPSRRQRPNLRLVS